MPRFVRGTETFEFTLDQFAQTDGRAARIAYYQLWSELLEDRWRRTTSFVDDIVVPVDDAALVAAVEREEPGALSVFTDSLLDRNDPRGELAALRRSATPDDRAIKSLEKTRGLELYGPLAFLSQRWRDQFAFVWRDGWVDHIVFRRVTPERGVLPPETELLQHVLHAPMARFVRSVEVDRWYSECIGSLFGCSCLTRDVRVWTSLD